LNELESGEPVPGSVSNGPPRNHRSGDKFGCTSCEAQRVRASRQYSCSQLSRPPPRLLCHVLTPGLTLSGKRGAQPEPLRWHDLEGQRCLDSRQGSSRSAPTGWTSLALNAPGCAGPSPVRGLCCRHLARRRRRRGSRRAGEGTPDSFEGVASSFFISRPKLAALVVNVR